MTMAETMTYDPGTDTVTTEGNLTEAEQDSLAVGTAMQEAQESLLAGKYKDAEALEKAYIELQGKLGQLDGQEETPEAQTKTEQEEVLPETSEEIITAPSPAAELITSASDEFAESGALTAETIEKFSSMSSKDLVEAYMQVQANLPQTVESNDITDAQVAEIRNFVGGENAYESITNWAAENLDKGSIQAFDDIISSGSTEAIKLAVSGLKAQYETANGYEGRMVTGKSPQPADQDVFRSQQELVRAMSDPRYDDDPAYRQDIMAKLDRSNNVQF